MGLNKLQTLWVFILISSVQIVSAQESCYGAGSIATSVVLSVIFTLLVIGALLYWIRRRPKTEHLILETDPEKGKAEYAFDNPGFKDAGLTPLSKSLEKITPKNESEKSGKHKWNNWPKLSALTSKSEKRKTLDDCVLDGGEVKVVALRSHDFTGLGFNICGNMKDGIHIKDILHRGPAFESGKLNPGDRINSVTISFEHIVYEDALTILSYASPYEVIIEAKSGKIHVGSSAKSNHPSHPIYRSSSSTDLQQVGKTARKKLYSENSFGSNHSTLHKSISNMTTLERKESKSPKSHQIAQKTLENNFNSEQLRNQLEQKISYAETESRIRNEPVRIEVETQKSENKHQKFGVKVFPSEQKKSPKTELSQNENNINLEKTTTYTALDEVDTKKPQAGIRKKKTEEVTEPTHLNRNDSLNGSGLKRDSNGIPQEIPSHMLNAAVAARRNRKSPDDTTNDEDVKVPKKKGKAPRPPPEDKDKDDIYEIKQFNEYEPEIVVVEKSTPDVTQIEKANNSKKSSLKGYASDSDDDNQSSVNTIELNSSDITIHHEENEEKQSRRTASTGDLSKIHKTRKSSTGTLERAQSLDITDSAIPTLTKKRKGGKIEDSFDMKSDEDLFGKAMMNKEPRLSLILDGLNTFQRNRLKKSTEWGNLEDAILRSSQDDTNTTVFTNNVSTEQLNFNFGEKSAELDALVNKINEIRRESLDLDDIKVVTTEEVKNQIWPNETDKTIEIEVIPPVKVTPKTPSPEISAPKPKISVQNEIWPKELESKSEITRENNEVDINLAENSSPNSNKHLKMSEDKSQDSAQKNTSMVSLENEIKLTNGTNGHFNSEIDSIPILNGTTLISNMIESEAPPELIIDSIQKQNSNQIELDVLADVKNDDISMKQTEVVPSVLMVTPDKSKIHKRQQIPNSADHIIPPPETNEPNLEDEIFEELRRNRSSPSPELETSPRTFICETSSSAISPDNILYQENGKRNSETGEICNNTDESKTLSESRPKYADNTENFILNERLSSCQKYEIPQEDTNISDDIKVSRHSLGSLERPKSDDAKSIESLKYMSNVSNVTINSVQTENGSSSLHSLEFSVNESSDERNLRSSDDSELYTTALSKTLMPERDSKVTISTPDLIKNVSITEAINTLNSDMDQNLSGNFNNVNRMEENQLVVNQQMNGDSNSSKNHSSLTYITEIQVTPNNRNANISEIEILPSITVEQKQYSRNLDNEFENYVKNFEVKNSDAGKTVKNSEEPIEKANVMISKTIDPQKELHKIKEIAQEQLKKLPEMRFTTSSYESPSRIPEKRQSQIELLKSNFEKSPPKLSKTEIVTKSRIPISTTMKTPPTSPERRDSKNLDMENEKEIIELMSSTVHSTPMTNSKYQKIPNKNVTVTSIRNNSKIPSGLPVLGGNRPPIPPKKPEQENDTMVQVSTNNTNISSFKQWVFDPLDSVTNISLSGHKHDQK